MYKLPRPQSSNNSRIVGVNWAAVVAVVVVALGMLIACDNLL